MMNISDELSKALYNKSKLEIANERIAELEAAQRWIPVSERLPENDESVLGSVMGRKAVDTCCYFDGEWWQLGAAIIVTHWMPLPKPPNTP